MLAVIQSDIKREITLLRVSTISSPLLCRIKEVVTNVYKVNSLETKYECIAILTKYTS